MGSIICPKSLTRRLEGQDLTPGRSSDQKVALLYNKVLVKQIFSIIFSLSSVDFTETVKFKPL